MPLIRPEISALVRRWSEVLSGFGVALFGLWMLQSFDRFFQLLGLGIVLAGLGLALIGWQRLRFQRKGQGAGIVQIVEGQISYFGPETGGFISLRDLVELHLVDYGQTWQLVAEDGAQLHIPVTAQGAEGLFDAFAQLPGIRMQVLLVRDGQTQPPSETLWLHPARRDLRRKLT